MGCDIHLYVEKRIDDRWISVDVWEPVNYGVPEESEERRRTVPHRARFYANRNYSLFAILANVRNGWGVGGITTGEGFRPIAIPRGLPSDVSPEVKAEADWWGCEAHSHSWLTLAELLSYDWNQTTTRRGCVDVLNYVFWKFEGRPRAWNAAVLGQSVKYVELEEMEEAVKWGTPPNGIYTYVQWQESYRDCADDFLTETLPRLRLVGRPDNVRIVFFFDN